MYQTSFQDLLNTAEKLLSSSLNQWGQLLATSDNLNAVWAQILSDPFLRRLLLRYHGVLSLIYLISFFLISTSKLFPLPVAELVKIKQLDSYFSLLSLNSISLYR